MESGSEAEPRAQRGHPASQEGTVNTRLRTIKRGRREQEPRTCCSGPISLPVASGNEAITEGPHQQRSLLLSLIALTRRKLIRSLQP